MDELLKPICAAGLDGDMEEVTKGVRNALNNESKPGGILNEALIFAMREVLALKSAI